MFNTSPTVYQEVIRSETDQFTKSSSLEELQYTNNPEDGSVIFPIKSNSKALQDLLTSSWKLANQMGLRQSRAYMDDVTDKIIKPDQTMPLSEAIKQLEPIRNSLDENLAGILFISDDIILNLLHPLVALDVIQYETLRKETLLGKLVIFIYKDKESLLSFYDEVEEEAIRKNINNIISMYTSKVNKKHIKTISTEVDDEWVKQTYMVSKEEGEDLEFDYYIVANQILTRGIVAPFYGVSIIKMNGKSTWGRNLTPFYSANILPKYDHRISINSPSDGYGDVCTGSISNKTIKGIRTLTHSNLSSPYITECISQGAIQYADACIDASINCYKIAKELNENSH